MPLTPEKLQILQRIETHLKSVPFYVIEYVRSKKRAGLSTDTLLQYLYRSGRPGRGYGHRFHPLFRFGGTEEAGRGALH